MALNNPADLFLYELAAAYDAERRSSRLLGEAIGEVPDGDAAQVLRTQEREGQQKIRNLDACYQVLGARPLEVPCAAIEGMRTELQVFSQLGPAPQAMEMYALGTAT